MRSGPASAHEAREEVEPDRCKTRSGNLVEVEEKIFSFVRARTDQLDTARVERTGAHPG